MCTGTSTLPTSHYGCRIQGHTRSTEAAFIRLHTPGERGRELCANVTQQDVQHTIDTIMLCLLDTNVVVKTFPWVNQDVSSDAGVPLYVTNI